MKYLVVLLYLISCNIIFTAEPKNTIAYVDVDYVFSNSKLKIRLEKGYSEQVASFLNARLKLENELNQLKQNLSVMEAILGSTEFKEKVNQYNEKKKNSELELVTLNKEFKEWEKEYQAVLIEDFYRVIKAYSIDEKIKIVFSKKAVLVSQNDNIDISDKIISLLEEVSIRDLPTVK